MTKESAAAVKASFIADLEAMRVKFVGLAEAALSWEEMGKLGGITDKAQVVDHLKKGFAHAKQALEAIDPATLVGKRRAMGQDRSTPEIVLLVAGDMHEHLGQLIAYARTNHIVPPWSK